MAPEIAIGLPYNESCDVYSFGIVLWQIMTLNIKPYGRSKKANSIDFFVQSVWHGKRERPSMRLNGQTVRRNFLPIIQTLVQSCWSHEWQHRPTMEVVESTLRDDVLFYTRAKNASSDNVDMDLLNDSRYNSCLGDKTARKNPRLLKSSSTSSLQRLLQANQKKITSLGSNRTRSTSSTTLFNGDLSPRRFFQRKNHAFLLPDASARRLTHQSRRSTFLFDDAAARIPDPTLLLDDCDFCDDDDDSM